MRHVPRGHCDISVATVTRETREPGHARAGKQTLVQWTLSVQCRHYYIALFLLFNNLRSSSVGKVESNFIATLAHPLSSPQSASPGPGAQLSHSSARLRSYFSRLYHDVTFVILTV